MTEEIVVNAENAVMGRLASWVAKRLLEGKRVHVVNAERAVISGRRESIFEEWDRWMETRTLTNPRKGPFHHRYPEDILRYAIRGMLPYKKPKGRAAFKRLRVHRGVPAGLSGRELVSVPEASAQRLKTTRRITLAELSRHLGAKL